MHEPTNGSVPAVVAQHGPVEALAQQVTDLQAELRDLRAQLERPSRRRRARHRRGEAEASGRPDVVSRRRLFGLLGGAAAAGAGLAVAGAAMDANPAGATAVTLGANDGDALQLGGANTCVSSTSLTASTAVTAFQVTSSNSGTQGIVGISSNGGGSTGLRGISTSGIAIRASAGSTGLAPLLLDPNSSLTGPPTTGTHNQGEFVVDSHGILFQCVTTGSPGTWVRQAPLVRLASPVRVYDSRFGQPNVAPNVQGSLVFNNPPPSATARTVSCALDANTATRVVPTNATALLMNLAVIPVQPPVGALAVFASGTSQPSASTINWPSFIEALANGATVACNSSQQVDVAIVAAMGAETNFLIDISGYYL